MNAAAIRIYRERTSLADLSPLLTRTSMLEKSVQCRLPMTGRMTTSASFGSQLTSPKVHAIDLIQKALDGPACHPLTPLSVRFAYRFDSRRFPMETMSFFSSCLVVCGRVTGTLICPCTNPARLLDIASAI